MSNNGLVKMWKRLSQQGRMYLVLALCCLMLVVSCGVSLVIVGFGGAAVLPDEDAGPAASSAPLNTESGYDKDQNVIDASAYSATILPQSSDAGQTYVDETLFLGDSNTARMYRLFDFCSAQNAIGSVGMSARQLATFGCAGFYGYNNYQTMPQAVALLQPKRVIITFGTNDLNPSNSTANFISGYQTGIQAVQAAYPSVDIIVNSIPPLGQQRSGTNLTQSQVDEYNKGIVAMCEENGWKFLNSAETLKDPQTGFAKDGYTETSDGIHLTRAAMEALFTYVRTHSYVTEDDRPPLSSIPSRGEDRDVVVPQVPVVSTPEPTETSAPEQTEEPDESAQEPQPDQGGETAPAATPEPPPVVVPEPTPVPTQAPAPEPTAEATTGSTSGTDGENGGSGSTDNGNNGNGDNENNGNGNTGSTDSGNSGSESTDSGNSGGESTDSGNAGGGNTDNGTSSGEGGGDSAQSTPAAQADATGVEG